MILNRKRAYISVILILMVFGAAAYYANEQANKLHSLEVKSWDAEKDDSRIEQHQNTQEKDTTVPPAPVQTPPQDPVVIPPVTSRKAQEKVESIILTASEFTSEPKQFYVTKGRKANLIIKTDSRYSGPEGLSFSSTEFPTKTIAPGAMDSIVFTAKDNFVIDVYKKGEQTKLYSIIVLIK